MLAVYCDLTYPIAGEVQDGTDEDIVFTSLQATYAAKWSQFSDPESKIWEYFMTIQRKGKYVTRTKKEAP